MAVHVEGDVPHLGAALQPLRARAGAEGTSYVAVGVLRHTDLACRQHEQHEGVRPQLRSVGDLKLRATVQHPAATARVVEVAADHHMRRATLTNRDARIGGQRLALLRVHLWAREHDLCAEAHDGRAGHNRAFRDLRNGAGAGVQIHVVLKAPDGGWRGHVEHRSELHDMPLAPEVHRQRVVRAAKAARVLGNPHGRGPEREGPHVRLRDARASASVAHQGEGDCPPL
mmetsp:Transcript_87802/g.248781  ORF Transcript_87802/g.248781 Transcript_87802/m.248781 type:complete len:228 (-) Transcript_87802:90-773(-)